MSPAELAAIDEADRRRVLVAALHEAERGLALRAAQRGRTDAMSRNVDRLRRELAELVQTPDNRRRV